MPSPSWSFSGSPGQESQASPRESPSAFAWVGLETAGPLSFWPVLGGPTPEPAQMPSLSWSLSGSPGQESQASPRESASALAWLGFDTVRQLSFLPVFGGLKASPAQMPSLSWSFSG